MKQLKYHMVFQGASNLLNPSQDVNSLAGVSTDRRLFRAEYDPAEASNQLIADLNIAAIARYDQITFHEENTYLAYILQSSARNEVWFEAQTTQCDRGSFQAMGQICFGSDQHVLHISTLGQVQLLEVPEVHSYQGAIAFQVKGGTGVFDQATGMITANFLVNERGDYRDVHTATIFLHGQPEDSVAQENRLLVRDVLDEKAFPIMADVSMEYVADLLALTDASQLMVIDGEGNFVGVVSEVDLLQALIPDIDEILRIGGTLKDALNIFICNGRDRAGQPIARLVTTNPRTVSPTDELLAVATVMLQSDIRRLPVVDQGKFVGSVALSDICWAVLSKWNGIRQS